IISSEKSAHVGASALAPVRCSRRVRGKNDSIFPFRYPIGKPPLPGARSFALSPVVRPPSVPALRRVRLSRRRRRRRRPSRTRRDCRSLPSRRRPLAPTRLAPPDSPFRAATRLLARSRSPASCPPVRLALAEKLNEKLHVSKFFLSPAPVQKLSPARSSLASDLSDGLRLFPLLAPRPSPLPRSCCRWQQLSLVGSARPVPPDRSGSGHGSRHPRGSRGPRRARPPSGPLR
ncbi:MAG: hypothetical protein BJ554DRAFT_8082, partial [Olpidium bornovanus]